MVEILFPRTAAQRAVIIAHFIDLAAFLLNNGDAETTLNIITALTDSKARIRSSWAMLEDTHSQSLASTTNLLTDFKAYMNFVYSYKRPVVQVCSEPLLPSAIMSSSIVSSYRHG